MEASIEAAAPILNNIYKNMTNADSVSDYFAILDVLQSVSMHRMTDHPVKELILFHSMHAGIYQAVWHGLFDTLQVMSTKMEMLQQIDLVAAELDYPMTEYTNVIVASIKSYAETLNTEGGVISDKNTYAAAPMKFTDPNMRNRFELFMAGLSVFMQQKTHLFSEPGIYMSMMNGVAL
jgi:hypothetical protein